MKTKKILLPDVTLPGRKPPRPRRPEGRPSPILLVTDRQRSEAIGLVLVGLSTFCLTLLYYLQSSRMSSLANAAAVQLGLGIYILPVMIGILGMQRFLDRPFRNLGLRLLGILGALLAGLALLSPEGGKWGSWLAATGTFRFGPIPTQVFFFFFLLTSLIFALDILYKDVLAAMWLTGRFIARVSFILWEIALAGVALFIKAWRQTMGFLFLLTRQIASSLQSTEELAPCSEGAGLLEFHPSTLLPEETLDSSQAAAPSPSPSPSPAPSIPPTPSPVMESSLQRTSTVLAEAECAVTIQNILVGSCTPTIQSLGPRTPETEETATNDLTKAESVEKTGEPEEETAVDEDLTVLVELEEIRNGSSDEEDDSPVSLDDHPIDRDLKEDHHEGETDDQESIRVPAKLPPLDLLNVPSPKETSSQNELAQRSALLLKTLEEFGLKATITAVVEGPAVSRFELKPAPGIKVSRITSLTDDIALALAAPAIRIEAPIPGKSALGIEIPNPKPTPVFFYDLVKHESFRPPGSLLTLALGITISGRPVFADLTDMPHLLIAGSTGSGKSVCVNTIIASILFQARADEVKLVMIDPKIVELSSYNGIPHLISPVVTDPKKASGALLWAVEEVERRYGLMALCGARNISTYNQNIRKLKEEVDPALEAMPFIVIIIDELADLMMTSSAEVEGSICRLAQMARAVGIHLVIATQRPSVDVLTGLIKSNLPSRIAFSVASQIDSRTILDSKGAEKLLGKGDMLFVPKGRNKPLRVQGAFISDGELHAITEFVKSQGKPEYIDIAPTGEDDEDDGAPAPAEEEEGNDGELLTSIEDYLSTQEKTSTSMLQRKFKIGYNRAARIMDLLEEKGIVSASDGSNKRRVLGRRSSTQA